MDSYTPDILEGKYARFLLTVETCPECGRFMVIKPSNPRCTFPFFIKLNFDAQAAAAGLGIRSDLQSGNDYICQDCANAGKAWFYCELCKEKKSTGKVQQSFGDPTEFLCIDCYGTVPAKEWEEAVDRLYKSHRYDFR